MLYDVICTECGKNHGKRGLSMNFVCICGCQVFRLKPKISLFKIKVSREKNKISPKLSKVIERLEEEVITV